MQKINIDYQLSSYVEQLFFEYQAKLNILKFLSNYPESEAKQYFNDYKQETEEAYIKLEMAKQEIFKIYNLSMNKISFYHFDFNDNTILIELKD